MECPKCHFDHPQQTRECLKCGIVFEKYLAYKQSAAAAPAPALAPEPKRISADLLQAQRAAHSEFLCRAFALPGALLLGWFISWSLPTISAFLAMWPHEFGHATAAILCGYSAMPTAWFTTISEDRSRWIGVFLGLAFVAGAYYAYRMQRWFWVAMSAVGLLLAILGNLQTEFHSHLLFTFWGAGGAYVLSTGLMTTFYARPDHPLTTNQVRWGLLILGAIAFCFVYREWAGGFENIANSLEDTDERGPSDVMMLTTMYGWSIYRLIHTYWQLGYACLAALAIVYLIGLVQSHRMKAAIAAEIAQ